jgi:hypothetical protein
MLIENAGLRSQREWKSVIMILDRRKLFARCVQWRMSLLLDAHMVFGSGKRSLNILDLNVMLFWSGNRFGSQLSECAN